MIATRITPLRSESDWQDCRERLQAFEKLCAPDCFMSWAYQHAVWKLVAPEKTCWLMEVGAHGEPLATALWAEATTTRWLTNFRILRSLDYNVMQMAPMMLRAGREREACHALVDALPKLANASQTNLVRLYKINAESAQPLIEALKTHDVPHQVRPFNRSHRILLTDDLNEYFAQKSKKSVRNIRRLGKNLEKDLGGELNLQRHRGAFCERPDFETDLQKFEDLRCRSWQLSQSGGNGHVHGKDVMAFYREACEDWKQKGWLDLIVMQAGETPVAGQLNVIIDQTQWVVLTAYDQKLARYSPGRVMFYRQLFDSFVMGDRLVDFGGENEDWKQYWSNDTQDTLQISWAMRGLKSAVWSLAQKLLRSGDGKMPLPIVNRNSIKGNETG